MFVSRDSAENLTEDSTDIYGNVQSVTQYTQIELERKPSTNHRFDQKLETLVII